MGKDREKEQVQRKQELKFNMKTKTPKKILEKNKIKIVISKAVDVAVAVELWEPKSHRTVTGSYTWVLHETPFL